MLVATTVIEVGVDVPNATVMIVEDAERFGLAQLHQLRGRIGRGEHAGRGPARSPTPSRREAASAWTRSSRTNDGFELAEQDLRLRGEGQVLGERQHGLPELRLASLIDDADLLELARADARRARRRRPAPRDARARARCCARCSARFAGAWEWVSSG